MNKDFLLEFKEDPDMQDKEVLWEMASIRGKYVITDDVNFSFHFLAKNEMRHAIRVKISWNKDRISDGNFDGYVEAHGDYRYYQSPKSNRRPSKKEIDKARMFVRKYKVLFAAVWEYKLDQNFLIKFFEGDIDFRDLLSRFENITEVAYYLINHCKNLTELEKCIRENNIFNLND